VKVKNLEDEVVKAERNCDTERYSRDALKHEFEDLQDELEKVAFQLKRKEKLIIE
jgi:cell division protein FtsB